MPMLGAERSAKEAAAAARMPVLRVPWVQPGRQETHKRAIVPSLG